MENKEKTFSIIKLLLTIFCTVALSVFVGSTILFGNSIEDWSAYAFTRVLEPGSELLTQFGKNYDQWKDMEEYFEETKAKYGEDYPVEDIFLFQIMNFTGTEAIVQLYSLAVIIGIILGTIIYIVAIQKTNNKRKIIQLIIGFIILFIITMLINLGFESFINALSIEGNGQIKDIEVIKDDLLHRCFTVNNILVLYIIAATLIYVANMVREKIMTIKLNKQ